MRSWSCSPCLIPFWFRRRGQVRITSHYPCASRVVASPSVWAAIAVITRTRWPVGSLRSENLSACGQASPGIDSERQLSELDRVAGGEDKPCPRLNMAEEFTPNGCRFDNGRCFDRLEWDESDSSVLAYFHDGSTYKYFGLSRDDAELWMNQKDPGCYFNFNLWPGTFRKLNGPTR